MPELNIRLIYPEKRWVKASELMMGAADAKANGETDEQADTIEDAIRILEDLGQITVDRKGR